MTDNNKSDAILSFLDELRKQIKSRPTSAIQGLKLLQPAEKQLHHLKKSGNIPEIFVLVTDVKNGRCNVIPGSFDAMQGGPDDAVLPKSVMGDYVTLAMDLATDLPLQSLGTGFAILDDKTYQRVLNTMESFNGKEVEGSTFSFALPYIGKSDERITYHSHMKTLLEQARRINFAQPRHSLIFKYINEQAMAAGNEKKNFQFNYVLENKNLVCFAEYSQHDKTFSFYVTTVEGKKCNELDHCQLVEKSTGKQLGVIQNGVSKFEYNPTSDSEIQILDDKGIELPGYFEDIEDDD